MADTMYHVAGLGWTEGEDLLSYDEQEARYGQPPAWIWDGEPCDTDVVCLFESLGEAVEMRDGFRPGCRILAVDVTDLHLVRVEEGYPAVMRLIKADRLAVAC